MIVLDCSAVLSMVFEDEGGEYAEQLFAYFVADSACSPEVWPLEVCNSLVNAVRRKRLVKAEANHFFRLISALPIRIEPTASSLEGYFAVLELSSEYQLSACDASYLALAMDGGFQLATLDNDLRRAARRCGVPIFGE